MADSSPGVTYKSFTAGDGYVWRYRQYEAVQPRGHVVFLHGIQSHAGWYEFSCQRLAQEGYVVSFLDRRGSGVNELNRGDAPSFRRLLDDIGEFLHAQDHAIPTVLGGISWGGKLAVALQRRHPGLVQGLMLLCPGLFPKVRPGMGERLGIAWSRIVAPTRRFPIPLNDPELFTAVAEWQEFIRNDPLALHEATARLLLESFRLDFYLRFVPRRVHVPVLLLLAEHDRIIDNEKARRFVDRFATANKKVIEYPGAHHTLEFEPDRKRFVEDMTSWLKSNGAE